MSYYLYHHMFISMCGWYHSSCDIFFIHVMSLMSEWIFTNDVTCTIGVFKRKKRNYEIGTQHNMIKTWDKRNL